MAASAARLAFAVPLGLALEAVALSQAPPVPPQNTLPSREQIEQARPERVADPVRVQIDRRALDAPGPCPFTGTGLQTNISSITYLDTRGAVPPEEVLGVLRAVEPPEGTQPVEVVCQLRDRAAAALREAGYFSSVLIPPQRIDVDSRQLVLTVVTSRIVEIRTSGATNVYLQTLRARAEQLKRLDPFNERDAERILLLAGDLPGLDVQMALSSAGTEPGALIADLSLGFRRTALIANTNNFGSAALGRETGYVRAEAYGLTGLGDRTYIGASSSLDFKRQHVLQLGHGTSLGNRGGALEAAFTYGRSRPDVGELDLRSESLIGRIEASQALQRSVRRNLTMSGGFEVIEQRTKLFGNETALPVFQDKLRVAFLRIAANERNPLVTGSDSHSVSASLELRQGLDIFGASEAGELTDEGFTQSRFDGKASATVLRAELGATKALGERFSLSGTTVTQWASSPLLSFEEYSAGNLTIGRGYDPGAFSGDRAIALRGEGRALLAQTALGIVEAFGFYDSFWLWNLDTEATENGRRFGSFGGGLRFALPGTALLEIVYAHPEKAVMGEEARRNDRLLLSLTVQAQPR